MRIEQQQVVRAPRERVFAVWTDCEKWPEWDPGVFTQARVVERAGNTVRVQMRTRFMGLTMPRSETWVLTPPERIDVQGDIPGIRNRTVWTFEEIPDGTLLVAVLDIRPKAILGFLGPVMRRQGQTLLRKWMRALADHVEAGRA
jgi:uncharacterized protein YndB with AHSA1/START domain